MKGLVSCFFFILCAACACALEFTIAPLYFIDESSGSVEPRNNWHRRILEELTAVETGTGLRFRAAASALYNPPQSTGDAVILCRTEQAEYLLYGFITRKDYSIQGELRLLDYERKELIASFYAMDNRDAEEELVKSLAAKVLAYVQEQYHIEIFPDPPAFTHLQFPISLGYWLPVNPSWTGLLIGIFRIEGGVRLIPSDHVFTAAGYTHYFSLGVDIAYQLARGHYYDAWDHGFTVSIPFQLYRKLNEQHEVFAGVGLSYSINLLSIKKPYEDPAVESYSGAGIFLNAGWQFRLKEKVFFFTQARMDIRFYDIPMVAFSPSAGVVFRRSTWEVPDKW
jgi:hypothetical protein